MVISSGEGFSGHFENFLLWVLRTKSYGSGKKGKEEILTCVWLFHEERECKVSMTLLGVMDDSQVEWKHLETQAACFFILDDAHVIKSCVCSVEIPGMTLDSMGM